MIECGDCPYPDIPCSEDCCVISDDDSISSTTFSSSSTIPKCPKCGNDIIVECLTTYPPKYREVCHKCGWSNSYGVIAKNDESVYKLVKSCYICGKSTETIDDIFCERCKEKLKRFVEND